MQIIYSIYCFIYYLLPYIVYNTIILLFIIKNENTLYVSTGTDYIHFAFANKTYYVYIRVINIYIFICLRKKKITSIHISLYMQ